MQRTGTLVAGKFVQLSDYAIVRIDQNEGLRVVGNGLGPTSGPEPA